MIEGHGDDLHIYGDKVRHNFSSNVVPGFDHSALIDHMSRSGWMLDRYPEPTPRSLEASIAEINGVDADEVLVTNGATEAIYSIARLFSGQRSAIQVPAFREYQDACRLYGHDVRFALSTSELDTSARLVWLCNPANPTGIVTPAEEIPDLCDRNRDTVFVIDQAYSDYTECRIITASEAVKRGNILLLGSLTKRFAVPGMRVGYVTGNSSLLGPLRAERMPWQVGGPAIVAAQWLIDHREQYVIPAAKLHSEALRIAREFNSMGITTTPTDCNFILCKLPAGSAAYLKDWLVDNHGLLIRNAENFETLTPRHFRVAAQRSDQNDLLINAVRQWITSFT